MKGIFGLIGLLVSLAIVGVLAKKQLAATHQSLPVLQVPMSDNPDGAASAPTGTVKAQAQQISQQYQQAVEAAMQPRAMPDDK